MEYRGISQSIKVVPWQTNKIFTIKLPSLSLGILYHEIWQIANRERHKSVPALRIRTLRYSKGFVLAGGQPCS